MFKKLKERYNRWIYTRRLKDMVRCMKALDFAISRSGVSRAERRQIWGEFKKSKDHAGYISQLF